MPFEMFLSKTLQSQSIAYGFWLTLPCAAIAKEILQATSSSPDGGFSWVLVDAEHGLITDREYYELCTAIAAEGVSPLIRVPWSEEWMIKRALDAGAHGVMTPMCHTEEDARRVVQYSKYPPLGTRGYGPSFAAHSHAGLKAGSTYDDGANGGLMVVVQIESRSGVENVEKIARVDGIDALLIGPFDLAKQMGVVRGESEHEAAIQRILKAAKDAGKKAAIFCVDGKQAATRAQQGFDIISVTIDTGVISAGMIKELSAARGRE